MWVFDDISTQMVLLEAERKARAAALGSEERYRLLLDMGAVYGKGFLL